MKLADIINQARRKSSEGQNFVRNPTSVIRRHIRRYAESWYKEAEVGKKQKFPGIPGFKKKNKKSKHSLSQDSLQQNSYPPQSSYPQNSYPQSAYQQSTQPKSHQPDEFVNDRTSQKSSQTNSFASTPTSQFSNTPSSNTRVIGAAGAFSNTFQEQKSSAQSPLAQGAILKGTWWGRYSIDQCLQENERDRLYSGLQCNGNNPVWIYEYQLLETDFNQKDADTRRHAFQTLIDLNLRLGSDRNFRILKLQDVVASIDRRCFLILSAIPNAVPLADELQNSGPMDLQQVRRVLHQSLQTLQYLHNSYRVRWPNNTAERGLYHGNLTLESLWIRKSNVSIGVEEPQFFIYFDRFALWEHLFSPPSEIGYQQTVASSITELGSISKDLKALGLIGFYLLCGSKINPYTHRSRNPQNPEDWPEYLHGHPLQRFIHQLLEIDSTLPFKSAGIALTELNRVPLTPIAVPYSTDAFAKEEVEENKGIAWYWIAACAVIGGTFGLIAIKPFFSLLTGSASIAGSTQCAAPCRLQAVTDLPANTVKYGIETGGAWQTAFDRAQAWPPVPEAQSTEQKPKAQPTEQKLESTLEYRVADAGSASLDLALELKSNNPQELYEAIASEEIDFALMQLPATETALPNPDLTASTVAYDGIVAVVPYSDATRQENIAQRLDGQISLTTLQEIYTGDRKELAGYVVEPYFPFEVQVNRKEKTAAISQKDGAIALFESILFSPTASTDDSAKQNSATPNLATQNLEAKQQFNQQLETQKSSLQQSIQSDLNSSGPPLRYDLFARMFRDFEGAVSQNTQTVPIAIGFERLSRVYGQCSVYPLAISNQRKTIQPLMQTGDQPINLQTNLCDDKGSYWPNVEAFHSGAYPLTTNLSVVYKEGSATGEAITQLLGTAEGQYLLSEAGLIPTIPIPQLKTILWSPSNEK